MWVALNPFIWIFWALDVVLWLLLPLPGLGVLKMLASVRGCRLRGSVLFC